MKKLAPAIGLSVLVCMAFRPYTPAASDVSPTVKSNPIHANHDQGLRLRFMDVFTGISVVPDRVQVTPKNKPEAARTFLPKDMAANGSLWVAAETGSYDVAVFAGDYKAMSSSFVVGTEAVNINFNLYPYSPPQEVAPEYIRLLHKDHAMLVYGYVVNDATGQPINNVSVASHDGIAATQTQSNGYFRLVLPLPHTLDEAAQRGKLVFTYMGYSTEIRENFDLWPRGDIGLKVRMKTGTGQHAENILTHRPADVTLIEP